MPRGLPRPLHQSMPLPYTSDATTLHGEVTPHVSVICPGRQSECIGKGLCFLCGEPLDPVAFFFVSLMDGEDEVGLIDSGAFHRRCAKMTVRHCPHIRELNDKGKLDVYRGPRAEVEKEMMWAFRGKHFRRRKPFVRSNKSLLGG